MSTSQQQAGQAGGFSGDLSLRSAAFRMSGRLIMNDSEGSPGLQSLCTQDFAEAVLKHERAYVQSRNKGAVLGSSGRAIGVPAFAFAHLSRPTKCENL